MSGSGDTTPVGSPEDSPARKGEALLSPRRRAPQRKGSLASSQSLKVNRTISPSFFRSSSPSAKPSSSILISSNRNSRNEGLATSLASVPTPSEPPSEDLTVANLENAFAGAHAARLTHEAITRVLDGTRKKIESKAEERKALVAKRDKLYADFRAAFLAMEEEEQRYANSDSRKEAEILANLCQHLGSGVEFLKDLLLGDGTPFAEAYLERAGKMEAPFSFPFSSASGAAKPPPMMTPDRSPARPGTPVHASPSRSPGSSPGLFSMDHSTDTIQAISLDDVHPSSSSVGKERQRVDSDDEDVAETAKEAKKEDKEDGKKESKEEEEEETAGGVAIQGAKKETKDEKRLSKSVPRRPVSHTMTLEDPAFQKYIQSKQTDCNTALRAVLVALDAFRALFPLTNVFDKNLAGKEAVHLTHDNESLKQSIKLLSSTYEKLNQEKAELAECAHFHSDRCADLRRLTNLVGQTDQLLRSLFAGQVKSQRWETFSHKTAMLLSAASAQIMNVSAPFEKLKVEQAKTVADYSVLQLQENHKAIWFTCKDVNDLPGIKVDALIDLVLEGSTQYIPLYDLILKTFFMTMEYYSSTAFFLERLMLHYCIVPPARFLIDQEEAVVGARRKIQPPIRTKVVKLLTYWLTDFFGRDFYLNRDNLDTLRGFVDNTVQHMGGKYDARQLKKLVEKNMELHDLMKIERDTQFKEVAKEDAKEEEEEGEAGEEETAESSSVRVYRPTITDAYVKKVNSIVVEPSLCVGFDGLEAVAVTSASIFLEVDVQELAQQMTLMESKCYTDIQMTELLQQVWNNKKERQARAPTLMWVFEHFNSVSAWVTDALLNEESLERRASIMRRIIVLAMHLLALNNYNGLIEVVSGLNNTAVDRLWATWDAIGPELFTIKQLMSALCSSNMKVYRYQWNQTLAPCVPYIGLFLTDLTFFEDGNPSYLKGKKQERKQLNFQKFLKVEKTISGLLYYQDFPYSLPYCPKVYAALTDTLEGLVSTKLDDNAAYKLSTTREPGSVTGPLKEKLSQSSIDVSDSKAVVMRLNNLRQHRLLENEIIVVNNCPAVDGLHVPTEYCTRAWEERVEVPPNHVRTLVNALTIEEIFAKMRKEVQIKAKKHRLKSYNNCVGAAEVVTWLVENVDFLKERSDAVTFGKVLIRRRYLAAPGGETTTFRDKARDILQVVENTI